MKNSELLKMIAQANRDCGYSDYAEVIDKYVTVEKAQEIINERSDDGTER